MRVGGYQCLAPAFVSRAAIESYNNGVRDGFLYGFFTGVFLALIVKAIKIILKDKETETAPKLQQQQG